MSNTARTESDVTITAKWKDQASKGLQKLQTQLHKGLRVAALAAAAAIGTTTAAVILLTKRVADLGDELAKTSKRTGISVEFLSKIRHAANLADVEFGELTVGIRQLARNMYDADRGLEAAELGFKKLGINIHDSAGQLRGIEDIFLEVAEAFANMENETQAMALAQELLGRSGTNLLSLFKEGVPAIRDYMKEAERLGIVWSKKDAMAAEEFNDAITRLKAAFSGLAKVVGIEFVNIFKPFIDHLREMVIAFREENTERIKKFAAELQGMVEKIDWNVLLNNMKTLTERVVNLGKWSWENQDFLGKVFVVGGITLIVSEVAELIKTLKDLQAIAIVRFLMTNPAGLALLFGIGTFLATRAALKATGAEKGLEDLGGMLTDTDTKMEKLSNRFINFPLVINPFEEGARRLALALNGAGNEAETARKKMEVLPPILSAAQKNMEELTKAAIEKLRAWEEVKPEQVIVDWAAELEKLGITTTEAFQKQMTALEGVIAQYGKLSDEGRQALEKLIELQKTLNALRGYGKGIMPAIGKEPSEGAKSDEQFRYEMKRDLKLTQLRMKGGTAGVEAAGKLDEKFQELAITMQGLSDVAQYTEPKVAAVTQALANIFSSFATQNYTGMVAGIMSFVNSILDLFEETSNKAKQTYDAIAATFGTMNQRLNLMSSAIFETVDSFASVEDRIIAFIRAGTVNKALQRTGSDLISFAQHLIEIKGITEASQKLAIYQKLFAYAGVTITDDFRAIADLTSSLSEGEFYELEKTLYNLAKASNEYTNALSEQQKAVVRATFYAQEIALRKQFAQQVTGLSTGGAVYQQYYRSFRAQMELMGQQFDLALQHGMAGVSTAAAVAARTGAGTGAGAGASTGAGAGTIAALAGTEFLLEAMNDLTEQVTLFNETGFVVQLNLGEKGYMMGKWQNVLEMLEPIECSWWDAIQMTGEPQSHSWWDAIQMTGQPQSHAWWEAIQMTGKPIQYLWPEAIQMYWVPMTYTWSQAINMTEPLRPLWSEIVQPQGYLTAPIRYSSDAAYAGLTSGKPGGSITINNNVQAIDSKDAERWFREDLLPMLKDAIARGAL